jgi:hypothetical protein
MIYDVENDINIDTNEKITNEFVWNNESFYLTL